MNRFFLLLLTVFVGLSTVSTPQAHAHFGDMESSGAPTPPYIPDSPFAYDCTLRVSYQIGEKYESAVLKHQFTNADAQNGSIDFTTPGREAWALEMKGGKTGPITSGPLTTLVQNQVLSMMFSKNFKSGDVRTYMNLNLQRQGKNQTLSIWSHSSAPFNDGRIDSSVSVNSIPKMNSANSESISFDVTCVDSTRAHSL